jgi:enterochelin esterase-like enzyme
MRGSLFIAIGTLVAALQACTAGETGDEDLARGGRTGSPVDEGAGGSSSEEGPPSDDGGGTPATQQQGEGGEGGESGEGGMEGAGAGGTSTGGAAGGDMLAKDAGSGGAVAPLPGAVAPPDGHRTIGPTYTRARETRAAEGVPTGRKLPFVLSGTASKIFPGSYQRDCAIYVPAQYVPGTPAPFVVLLDGGYPFNQLGALERTLDTLIHEKKLAPTVAIFAGNRDSKDAESQRQTEYNTTSSRYGDWVERELLPAAQAETARTLPAQAVTLSKKPQEGAAMGCSSGGTGVVNMVWYRPDRFGRGGSFSASFLGPAAGFASMIGNTSPVKPMRLWLEAGASEPEYLAANKRVAGALSNKKYSYHFDLAQVVGHCSLQVVYQTLPEMLLWMFRE